MAATGLYEKRYWLIVILAIGMVGALIISLVVSRRDAGANLEIIAAPKDITIIIEDREYKAGKITLEPGTYTVRAEREGFANLTQEISVGDELKTVTFALTPETEEAKKLAAENRGTYAEVESLGGQIAQQEGQQFRDAYPLVGKLPRNTSLYSINYTHDLEKPGKIYIRIDSTSPVGRQVAIAQIREWGFDPTDYNIVFAGLYNPFDPAQEETPGE